VYDAAHPEPPKPTRERLEITVPEGNLLAGELLAGPVPVPA
jgi:hypothetical protein